MPAEQPITVPCCAPRAARGPVLVVLAMLTLALGSPPGAGAAPASFSGASADGETVVFTTSDQLVPGDTDTRPDVYQRSYDEALERYVTREVSTGPVGGNDAFTALYDGVSATGSGSSSPPASRWSWATPTTARTSTCATSSKAPRSSSPRATRAARREGCGNGNADSSFVPGGAMPNGERVFFSSEEQLSPPDGDASRRLHARPRRTATTVLVSAGDASCAGRLRQRGPARHLPRRLGKREHRPFFTTDEKLAAGDTDGLLDIYARDLGGGVDLARLRPRAPARLRPRLQRRSSAAARTTARMWLLRDQRADLGRETTTAPRTSTTGRGGRRRWSRPAPPAATARPTATFAGISADGSTVFFETERELVAADTDPSRTSTTCRGSHDPGLDRSRGRRRPPRRLRSRWVSPDGASPASLFSTDRGADQRRRQIPPRTSTSAPGESPPWSRPVPRCGNGEVDASFAGPRATARTSSSSRPSRSSPRTRMPSPDIYDDRRRNGDPGLDRPARRQRCLFRRPSIGASRRTAPMPSSSPKSDSPSTTSTRRPTSTTTRPVARCWSRSETPGPVGPAALRRSKATNPASPGPSTTPAIIGQADPNSSIKVYTTSDCSGDPVATGTVGSSSAGPGSAVAVAAGSTTSFRATATDAERRRLAMLAPVSYTQQDAPPPPPDPGGGERLRWRPGRRHPTAKQGGWRHRLCDAADADHLRPRPARRGARPVFRFTDSTGQAGTSFLCKVDRRRWYGCGSPAQAEAARRPAGTSSRCKAVNAVGSWEPAPAKRQFKVVGR